MQMVTNNTTVTLNHVTMLDQAHNKLTLRVTDVAGNETDTSLEGDVDLIPPGPVAVTALATNVRQPNVKLTWNAVSGNATRGTGAASYEVRFSKQAIDSAAKFDGACKVDTLLKTGAMPAGLDSGQAMEFNVIGPDTRKFDDPCSFAPQTDPAKCNYYFAVRAIDAVGNKGDVTGSGSVNLCMHHIKVIAGTDFQDKTMLWQKAWPLGDINGDGLADVAVGGYASDMFCVIYGSKTPADVTLADAGGTDYQCIKGSDINGSDGFLGSPVVSGDIDNDGISDLVIGSGLGSNLHKVYVFFGVQNDKVSTTPNVVITGINTYANQVVANGDFNGDGYMDIMLTAKDDKKVYLIPGDPIWKDQTNLSIDLSDAGDLSTYKVVAFTLTDQEIGQTYRLGITLGYLRDINGDGKDEAVIRQYKNPGCYYVFAGRATTTSQVISVSTKWDNSGDQANVIRLRVDTGMSDSFSWDNDGLFDLGWGTASDLMLTDYYMVNHPLKRLFFFSGDFLSGMFGQDARIDANSGPISGILSNDNGTIITGNFQNARVAVAFDGLSKAGLAFTNGKVDGAQPDGYVYYRSNYAVDGNFADGTFPVTNMAFGNPYDTLNNDFARSAGGAGHLSVFGDFNGDGFSDIMIGRDAGDYQVILY